MIGENMLRCTVLGDHHALIDEIKIGVNPGSSDGRSLKASRPYSAYLQKKCKFNEDVVNRMFRSRSILNPGKKMANFTYLAAILLEVEIDDEIQKLCVMKRSHLNQREYCSTAVRLTLLCSVECRF